MAGRSPAGSSLAYCVSKAGLLHLTRCLAVALAPEVRVNALAPGFMDTSWYPMQMDVAAKAEATLLKRVPQFDQIAALAVSLSENDSLTGQIVVVDSGVVLR